MVQYSQEWGFCFFFSQSLIFSQHSERKQLSCCFNHTRHRLESDGPSLWKKRKFGVFIKHVRLHISQKFTSSLDIKRGKNKFRSRLQIRANKYVYNTSDLAFWSALESYFMKLTKSFGWGDDKCSVFISILNVWATTTENI